MAGYSVMLNEVQLLFSVEGGERIEQKTSWAGWWMLHS
jgi:hypothetical protein